MINDYLWESSSNLSAKFSDESDNDMQLCDLESKDKINIVSQKDTSNNSKNNGVIYTVNDTISYDIVGRMNREVYIDNQSQSYHMKFIGSFFVKSAYSTVFLNEGVAKRLYKLLDFSSIENPFVKTYHHLFKSITNAHQLKKFNVISLQDMTIALQSIIKDVTLDNRNETTNYHLCLNVRKELKSHKIFLDQFDKQMSVKDFLYNYVCGGSSDDQKILRHCDSERCVQPHHYRLIDKRDLIYQKKIKKSLNRYEKKRQDLEEIDYNDT
jgi:hypothetical protein